MGQYGHVGKKSVVNVPHQRPRSWRTVADIIFSVVSCQVIRKMGHYLKMSLTVPAEYVEGFTRANNTFLYQLVFDPVRRKVVPLSPYPQHLDVSTLSYAGLYPSHHVTADSTSNSVICAFYFKMDLDEAQLDIVADRKSDLFHADESSPECWGSF